MPIFQERDKGDCMPFLAASTSLDRTFFHLPMIAYFATDFCILSADNQLALRRYEFISSEVETSKLLIQFF